GGVACARHGWRGLRSRYRRRAMTLTLRRSTSSSRVLSVAAGAVTAVLLAPLVSNCNAFPVAAVVVAALMCRLTVWCVPRPRLVWLGAVVAVTALVLIGVTPT